MGTSEYWEIPWVLEVIAREQPKSVLDVGAGWGKFGMLARECATLERVDGIDVTSPRIASYDHFYEGDLRELDRLLPREAPLYDLALLIETIEHLEKAEAWAFLGRLTKRARKVLIATPWGFRRQEIPGMPFETHRSGWYPWEFRGRFRVHRWAVYPGHLTRRLHLPRLWQFVVLISQRDA
jgi:hypothetical protein